MKKSACLLAKGFFDPPRSIVASHDLAVRVRAHRPVPWLLSRLSVWVSVGRKPGQLGVNFLNACGHIGLPVVQLQHSQIIIECQMRLPLDVSNMPHRFQGSDVLIIQPNGIGQQIRCTTIVAVFLIESPVQSPVPANWDSEPARYSSDQTHIVLCPTQSARPPILDARRCADR